MAAPTVLVAFVPLVEILADVVLRPIPHVWVIFEVDALGVVALIGGVAVGFVHVVLRLRMRIVLRRPHL